MGFADVTILKKELGPMINLHVFVTTKYVSFLVSRQTLAYKRMDGFIFCYDVSD